MYWNQLVSLPDELTSLAGYLNYDNLSRDFDEEYTSTNKLGRFIDKQI